MRNPNGYGSVVKMSGKRRKPYAVRLTVGWTDDGKQIYKFLSYHASKADAIIALAEYNKSPYDIDANTITFADVYARYTADLPPETTQSIYKLNKTCFNHTAAIHGVKFRDLRKAHLQGIITDLETPTAKSNVAMFYRKLFKYAMENDIVLKDYSIFVTTPSKNRKTKKTPFTYDDINLFLENVGNVNAEIMLMLCYSGMRINELLLLEKSQINLNDDYIITGSKTEAGKDRYIPIHSRIKPLILKHYENNSKWLIVNSRGDKPIRYDSFHAKRWSKLKKKLAMRSELTIHSTRHFFVSELHALGADKLAVQKIIGHKGKDVTEETYTHIDNSTLHDIVNMLK